ncbi:GNAT family N-acetyltransferase [Actinomadura madurae]|uniref:GNAT family N-acetyltransferase n=1 Tax=Actinomadura madurae TaxID=1993 RepID=UPI0020D22EDD|nr:GNAT family N-acetyltransferase [Actinomadura madurae]MCP9968520.1 GNAT family N-acetyltransferase [Actinomadura madurae]
MSRPARRVTCSAGSPPGRVSARRCYAGVVEHSVYISPDARGLGLGAALLDAFIAATEAGGIWTVQAASSRRTPRASGCTPGPGSEPSEPGGASAA